MPAPSSVSTAPPHASSGGVLVATDGRLLPLQMVKLACDARGGLSRVRLEQHFKNSHDVPLDVTYCFPLPEDGAVSGFAFRLGDRRIHGEIERVQNARQRFERALAEGRSAALLEQDRSSLFTQEIANVPPGESIVVELAIDQRLAWADGEWEWRFPLAAAPRYLGAEGRVADARRIVQEVADRPLTARAALAMRVRDDLAAGQAPGSPSHRLRAALVQGTYSIGFEDAEGAPLDRDVVVRWPAARAASAISLDVTRAAAPVPQAAHAYGLLTITPPAPGPNVRGFARDVIVLIDTSGSMAGEPLAQARRVVSAIVDTLADRDRLTLVQFGADTKPWRSAPVPATAQNRREAAAWLGGLEASGGTEMKAGILEALRGVGGDAQRQIVLVTDGLIGFEDEVVAAIRARLPTSSRLHTVGVGSSVNRSLTGPAARAGRGVEVILGLGEDPERAARRIVQRTNAPVIVDLTVSGSAVVEHTPSRMPDLFAGAPVLVGLKLRPDGGDVTIRGRTASGPWEERLRIGKIEPGQGTVAIAQLFARETVSDMELDLAAGADKVAIDTGIERVGLELGIATRLTAWVAIDETRARDPRAAKRHERIPQALPHGMSIAALGLRAPSSVAPAALSQAPRSESFEEKTRVTAIRKPTAHTAVVGDQNDCLVVIYTKEPSLLGKRFVLDTSAPPRIGRGADNMIVLEGDSVSRRHAHLERRGEVWWIIDHGSTNGTYVNDRAIAREAPLANGDRVKIGPAIFKYLSGSDVEAQYHEEIYRMTIIDGLTGAHVKRYLLETLDRELIRARRNSRDLAVVMIDLDHFKKVNDTHGHIAGDHVLKEVARLIQGRIRQGEVLARYGGEEFCLVLPETGLSGAGALAEELRKLIAASRMTFQDASMNITASFGVALVRAEDKNGLDVVQRADQKLYLAKSGGRDRVCSE